MQTGESHTDTQKDQTDQTRKQRTNKPDRPVSLIQIHKKTIHTRQGRYRDKEKNRQTDKQP